MLGMSFDFSNIDDAGGIMNILRGDALFVTLLARAIDFFDPAIERSRNRVPEMQERIFLEADVDEHRLQPHLDVLNFSLVDATDDVPGGVALDVIFLEPAVLEQGHAAFEFLDADYEFVPGLRRTET